MKMNQIILFMSIQRVVSLPLMKTTQVPHIVGARPGVRQDGVHVSRLVQFAESTATPTKHVSTGMQQKPSEAELSCLSSEEETGISSACMV